ncbi:MAG: ATP-binding protein [Elusimicrobiales bacterium]|nr:ATP-binding protein [Elusimicrobiales bacterium]
MNKLSAAAVCLLSCCAAWAAAFFSGLAGPWAILLGAFLGAGLAAALCYALARPSGGGESELAIVQLAMSNTSDLVAVVDLEGRRIYNSPSYSLLRDPAQLKGTDSFNEIHPEDREKVRKIFSRTVATGKGERAEYRFLLPDKTVRYIESMGNVINGPDGKPGRVVIVSRDVTERKALEGQLRQAQKMEALGQLAGGVAHDFNNIITSLAAYADFIARSPSAGAQVAEDAAEIKKVCERAAGLSRQLLAFSRKQVLSPRIMDLNGIAAGVQKMLARLIGANIDLVIEKSPAPVPALVDPGQIEQVLLNLAVNARDAMPAGGRLVIKVFSCEYTDYLLGSDIVPGRYAVISVTDTGTGMPPEVKARVFEPFFTTKSPGSGTGLGLSTAYGIVRQSGGYISVESEPGRGTAFSVYLPLSEREPESATASGTLPALRRGTETILLVEDDTVLRSVTRRTLQENGYQVLEAATDSEALLLAEERHKGKIDLILADIVLPGMNGFDLAQRVAAANPGIARVYISGYTDPDIIKAEFITPETPLIQKPFTTDALLFGLRAALEAKKKKT